MRLGYTAIRLIEFAIVLLMAYSSMYSFLNNALYDGAMLLLEGLLMKMNITTPISLDVFIRLSFFSIFSLILLYFYAKGKEVHFNRFYTLAWLLHLPSILYFSRIDWLREMGLFINFQIFKTSLSFSDTLVIGAILVSGRILLYYTARIKETYHELIERGASKDDVESAISAMTTFSLIFIVFTSAIAFIASHAIPLLASFFVPRVSSIPYPYIVLGAISLVAIPAIIIAYIHSRR